MFFPYESSFQGLSFFKLTQRKTDEKLWSKCVTGKLVFLIFLKELTIEIMQKLKLKMSNDFLEYEFQPNPNF